MLQTTVAITTSFEGIHCYPEAPDEVAYLREPHRHIFNVTAKVQVFDDDREIEFIMLKHRLNEWLREHLANGVWRMGRLSCEQVAKGVLKCLYDQVKRPARRYWSVTVDEDGENGATVSGSDILRIDLNVDI